MGGRDGLPARLENMPEALAFPIERTCRRQSQIVAELLVEPRDQVAQIAPAARIPHRGKQFLQMWRRGILRSAGKVIDVFGARKHGFSPSKITAPHGCL
jgi:hypothetical protein